MQVTKKTVIITIVCILALAISTTSVILTVTHNKTKNIDTPTLETTKSTTKQEETTTETTTKSDLSYTVVKEIEGSLPYHEPVDSYWSEAVIVGDSITLKLQYYNGLPGATYLCKASFGVTNALDGVIYEHIEDDIANTGRKRVYIMLGMNDLNRNGVDSTVSKYKELIQRIIAKNPDCLIYVQSMTPTTKSKDGSNGGQLTNANINLFNQALAKMTKENGWYFVDVASAMYTEDGYLKDEYCGDNGPDGMGLHLGTVGCSVWADYLNTHQYDPSWK